MNKWNSWNNWRSEASHRHAPLKNHHRVYVYGSPCLLTLLLLAMTSVGITGCGNNLDLLLLRSAEATSRTFLDIFLTDLANTIAQQDADAQDNGGADDGNGAGNDSNPPDSGGNDGVGGGGSDGNGSLDNLVGDPVNGQVIYIDNGCGSCHCDDASGGCALEAPPIVGILIDDLNERTQGSADHPIKIDITNQDLADLDAYLASL